VSEQRTNDNHLIENARKVSRYMRDTLEELKQMLDGDPLKNAEEEAPPPPPAVTVTPPAPIEEEEKAEDMLRAAGDRIDPRSKAREFGEFLSDRIFGLPIIARVPYIPNNLAGEANGRDEPLPYEDPLNDRDVILDALDCDVLVTMDAAPQDQLDLELHVESCPTCQVNYFKLCAHCLEMKVCTDQPVQLRQALPFEGEDQAEAVTYFARLTLCRSCKRDADNTRGLLLEE